MSKSKELKKNDKISKKIKDHLNTFGITGKELSKNTGIELNTLYSIINGHQQPSVEKLERICTSLQISMDALLDLEVNTFPVYSQKVDESLILGKFEDVWFGPNGGERIVVSRNFSTANQSEVMRRVIYKNIYRLPDDQVEPAMQAFQKRQQIINKKEKSRIEVVVESEIIDFIQQRKPFDLIDKKLIHECVNGIISRLENDPLSFELIIIPRQFFSVNYEIINREVLVFDFGSALFRQTHPNILQNFLKEVEKYKYNLGCYPDRAQTIEFLRKQLDETR
ncbi:MAG: helix-turn-helix domain-containing protein [Melioribacteraceae bacterium]|nr:helix-turn-helix domain-containing protein [Melioribacteraceae bacterium]MCF8354081.1 helix-turn-helix domain-containing protein [Melioribacteraceae bacterium]MCF8393753.1 helix-turn-helix domain-containing protein [Melioribacteraceae bacterium]MCF8419497.1 helix-turn-helix domain-containing protein [Melioribacteraceae bacterium]